MSEEKTKNNFWVGFFLGGLVGAFIIFLMGTNKGKKIAEQLMEEVENYEEELEQKVANLHKKGEELLVEATNMKNKIINDVETSKKEVTDRLVNKMDTALTKIEDIQRKGVEITSEVHHRYFKKNGKKLNA